MKKQQRNRLIAAAVLTVLCALLVLVPFTGLEAQGKGVLIVFVWAILMWIVRPIPEYLIGVLAAAILAIFFGMKTNVVSGFSSSGWWLCLWAGFIGSAIKFSGLGERVAYWILVKMGKTELMANYATSIANTVLSLMIPSNTARGAVMSPICDNICEGMGYKRGEHKGDAAIMLSNLFTNTTNTWLFYTAVGANAIGMYDGQKTEAGVRLCGNGGARRGKDRFRRFAEVHAARQHSGHRRRFPEARPVQRGAGQGGR